MIFQSIRRNIKQYLIAGILLAFIAPALPAYAADDAAVDTTASQTTTSGNAVNSENGSTTEVPTIPQVPHVIPIDTDAPAMPYVCPVGQVPQVPQFTGAPYTNSTTATINNCINSDAASGNANVNGNGTAGNATSGNADVNATLLNLIQSTTGMSANGLATFTKDINGNYNDDYTIDPTILMALAAKNAACGCNALMQAYLNANINNNINLNASSGNASVTSNGSAGNATTGNANAMANIINIINSITNASQAFVGVINIYGDFNGNIILPAGWYDSLLAANPGSGSCSTNCSGSGGSNSNMDIINNINLTAITGDASVIKNGLAGDAATGDAATRLNIINLINRNIHGGNVLLVFVNVLGKWTGILMDAPVGSTTATIGGGITNDSSTCGCEGASLDLNAQITNNINLTATSGDALVGYNGEAGNASSGNATASLNLANIINSQFSLSGWLGVLFINVYGTWNGNLANGVAAETVVVVPVVIVPAKTTTPKAAKSVNVATITRTTSEEPAQEEGKSQVMGSLTNDGDDNTPVADAAHGLFMPMLAGSGMICCGILGALDRRNSKKQQHRAAIQQMSI